MGGKVYPQGALGPHTREAEQQGSVVGGSGPGRRFQATGVMVAESEAAVSRTPRAGIENGKWCCFHSEVYQQIEGYLGAPATPDGEQGQAPIYALGA